MDHITGQALLALERGHLVRLGLWALGSMALGALMLVLARRSGAQREFWRHAGIQSVAWGAVDLAIAVWASRGLRPRTLPEAIALDRVLWLNIGLDIGYVMVGLTLLAFGARAPRRLGLVGAGAAIIVQGLALAVLDGKLSAAIVR